MKKQTNKVKIHKAQLLIALEKSLGIVTSACKEVGLSRNTYYNYYENDDEFSAAVDAIGDITLDFAENQLFKKIKEGSERSILFYIKYKGKARGYNASLDITSGGDKLTTIINIIKPDDNKLSPE